jgi:hypothetical protein
MADIVNSPNRRRFLRSLIVYGRDRDEVDVYIESLINGTQYAKLKDQDAKVRMVARWYAVPLDEMRFARCR